MPAAKKKSRNGAPAGPSRPISRTRFADAVTRALRERAMTQGDLADAIGAAQPTVSDWLGRKKTPSPRYARAVLDALALSWDDVVEPDEKGGGGSPRTPARKEDLDAADVVLIPRLGHAGASHAGVLNGHEAPARFAPPRFAPPRGPKRRPGRPR